MSVLKKELYSGGDLKAKLYFDDQGNFYATLKEYAPNENLKEFLIKSGVSRLR